MVGCNCICLISLLVYYTGDCLIYSVWLYVFLYATYAITVSSAIVVSVANVFCVGYLVLCTFVYCMYGPGANEK